jgi:hypothetical protein
LLDPIWRGWDQPGEEDRLLGPIYCLVNRRGGDVVHMGSFLERCNGCERDRRCGLRHMDSRSRISMRRIHDPATPINNTDIAVSLGSW